MEKNLLVKLSFLLFFFFLYAGISAQTIKGQIKDADNNDPLIGANVVVKGTTQGTTTDYDGNFSLDVKGDFPITLVASYLGFSDQEYVVDSPSDKVVIKLGENVIVTDVVEVKGRRISERQKQSALTMETMDNIAIKETPAANFYDGLGSLKDVDLTAASLGFKIINTRGFNSTSPVRSLQIIDGVDNQSPGLNFSLGNFLGASELDVNSVNLIVGASSAFYGPNAFNGVISMQTKDPFFHKGLSAMVKVGERSLFEGAVRYADVVKNKDGDAFMAFKVNLSHMRANDWEADNFDPVFDTDTDETNPGGFDAVNIYGDEYETRNDLSGSLSAPGLNIWHRRGYVEKDLVDYDSRNFKVGAALHFRLEPEKDLDSPELILSSNAGGGTTVYQGDNRYSLRNIRFFQHRLEIKQRDKFFFRTYLTHENAGDSYDPYFTALQLQDRSKEPNQFSTDYINYWNTQVTPQIREFEGYPDPLAFLGRPDEFNAALSSFLSGIQPQLFDFHAAAQDAANQGVAIDGTVPFFEPGTDRFQAAFDDITSRNAFSEGGTRFFDKSALVHAHGEYKFNDLYRGGSITKLDLLAGANARLYMPNSNGSILLDTMGRNINTFEFGIYGGGTIEFNNDLKVNASLRMDKNQNFNLLLSPAASVVYTPSENNVLRFSFSSAIRNPTLADQYLFYNVGRAILLGNIDGFNNLVTVESLVDYFNTLNSDTLEFFDVPPIQPEKVRTFELGFRTTLFDRIYLDAGYYFSFYEDFIGFNFGVEASFDPISGLPINVQAFRVAANATERVTTQGFSLGFNYYFLKYFVFNGNYSFNRLNTATDDPIIPAFNTPEHKFNIGIAGRDVDINIGNMTIRNVGFNINYKWIEGFLFEGSPQFTGLIPSYDLLDAQINFKLTKLHTTLKIGASNLLDNQQFQTYGGPRIGRLAYASLVYDFKKK
ncbi:MAG: TonB-dependent receptor [Bacteroidota bacterium]